MATEEKSSKQSKKKTDLIAQLKRASSGAPAPRPVKKAVPQKRQTPATPTATPQPIEAPAAPHECHAEFLARLYEVQNKLGRASERLADLDSRMDADAALLLNIMQDAIARS